ncbi:unnamed protein product [Adineta ricciae]|uniref:Uncharacterized protein n=1 Tax=Adineta ricciae TaxID=249248 RepID=A0A816A5X7_ADIRI|nr:unnamed protein product [Adineta ricciae]CAF1591467.1 unnamed protein product [Adineta ricciae]
MNRTNRIQPACADIPPVKYAVMTITTQMEILKHVEVTPSTEEIAPQPTSLQSKTAEQARKILCIITCLFITAAVIALVIFLICVIITFAKAKSRRDYEIERYDLGDLQYGLNTIDRMNLPSHTYLSDIDKILVQKYFSDRLLNESGYRGLVIDGVSLQNLSLRSQRKQRNSPCSLLFTIQNLQIYFDQCPACAHDRQRALHYSFYNLTSFHQPLHLIIDNFNTYPQICLTPHTPPSSIPLNRSKVPGVSSNNTDHKSTAKTSLTMTTTASTRQSRKQTKPSRSTIPAKSRTTRGREISSTKVFPSSTIESNIFQFFPYKPSNSYFSQHNTAYKRSI